MKLNKNEKPQRYATWQKTRTTWPKVKLSFAMTSKGHFRSNNYPDQTRLVSKDSYQIFNDD